jgi:hypothetical protein
MICVNEQQDRRFLFSRSSRIVAGPISQPATLLGLSCVCDIFIPDEFDDKARRPPFAHTGMGENSEKECSSTC